MANTLDIKLLLSDDGTISNVQAKLADSFAKVEAAGKKSAEATTTGWATVTKSIERNEDAISKLGKGFTVVGTAVTGFFGLAVHEAAKSEQSNLKLIQSIKLAGMEMDSTKQIVGEFAASMQRVTGNSDELIQDFVGRLLPVTKDVGKAMDATTLAMDFAAGTGKDLSSVEQIMTQVLSGNVEVLRRSIPVMKSYTAEQLDSMTATQRTTLALDSMRKQFGGMAAVEGASAIGQFKVLKETMGDNLEVLGGMLLPTVISFVQTITSLIRSVTEWTTKHEILGSVLVKVTASVGLFALALGPVLLAIPTLATSINVALIPAFQALFAVLAANPLLAVAAGITAVITATTMLGDSLINQDKHRQKAISTTKEMIEFHKQEAEQIRKAIAQDKDWLDSGTHFYKSKEEMTQKYILLQKAIRFQEKQLIQENTKDQADADEELSKRGKINLEKRTELIRQITEREKLIQSQGFNDKLAEMDIRHADELHKLEGFEIQKQELAKVMDIQNRERQALVDQYVQEKSLAQAQLMGDIDAQIAQTHSDKLQEQLAAETVKFNSSRKKLEAWYKEEQTLAKLQGKDLSQVQDSYSKKAVEITEAEHRAKAEITKQARLQELSSLVSNLQELGKHSREAFIAYKAAAIVDTTIATYLGAQKAYSAMAGIPLVGPALGAAAAAVAIAAGMSRVSTIASQNAPTYHSGGLIMGAGEVPILAEAGEFVVRKEVAQKTLPILQKMNRGGEGGMPSGVTITLINYGDIRTEADEEELFKEWGNKIREAVRGES